VNKFCKSKVDGNAFNSMFVGMDVHKNYLQVAVLDEKGKILNNSSVGARINNRKGHHSIKIGL
jgi:hypothetical protein